ncbi:MAG: hypothetical protein ACJ73V_11120, partial [Acidimicrobiia bacterium]
MERALSLGDLDWTLVLRAGYLVTMGVVGVRVAAGAYSSSSPEPSRAKSPIPSHWYSLSGHFQEGPGGTKVASSLRLASASRHEARLGYMPALDGVRALAVVAVLL